MVLRPVASQDRCQPGMQGLEELRSTSEGSIEASAATAAKRPVAEDRVVLNKPSKQVGGGLQHAATMLLFSYRCPDCGWDIETLVPEVTSSERDVYQSTVCPNCQQLHSVNPANGEILVEDGLGDPW